MRGGRNKFGPIYRRDRALRRQIRSQLHNDPDLELVAKAAATATLAKADLEAIAKVAATVTTSKACFDGSPRSRNLLVSQPSSMKVVDVDLKPDVAELCGLVAGRDSVSNYTQQQQHGSSDLSATRLLNPSVQSPYLSTVTAVSQSATSDPLAGLSGMAAALLGQFLQQQRVSLPTTNVTSVPRVVRCPSTTSVYSVVSTPVLTTCSVLAPHTDVQHFNSKLTYPATPVKSVISVVRTTPHPVTPQQYMIPIIQTVSSAVTHQSVVPAVHVTPATSESVVSSVGVHHVTPLPSSLSSNSELQLSNLELSGVPATLRLIFDLKRQTSAGSRQAESSGRLRRFVEDLLQQPVSSVTSSMETAIQRAIALACRVCDQQLFLLVDWARQAHFFRHLSVNCSHLCVSDVSESHAKLISCSTV